MAAMRVPIRKWLVNPIVPDYDYASQKAVAVKIESAFRLLLSLVPAVAGGGCATHALWTKAELDDCNLPAQNANLRLFADGSSEDLVVVYDEYSERHDSTRTRAYLLRQNQNRIERQRSPLFAKTKSVSALKPVPVFLATNAISSPSPPFYAVLSTNDQSFTLCSNGHVTGPFALPVYNDGKGKVERIALTPLAATADLTIVGGVLGYYCAVALWPNGHSFKGP
jgi:hypothetical protein